MRLMRMMRMWRLMMMMMLMRLMPPLHIAFHLVLKHIVQGVTS